MAEAAELAHREQAAAVVVRVFFDGSAFLNCRLQCLSPSALVALQATQAAQVAQVLSVLCFLHMGEQVEQQAPQAVEAGVFLRAAALPQARDTEQSIQALQRELQPIAAVAAVIAVEP